MTKLKSSREHAIEQMEMGKAEIGNWTPEVKDVLRRVRYFNGLIDDFMLYDRVLTADEIKRQARQDAEAK